MKYFVLKYTLLLFVLQLGMMTNVVQAQFRDMELLPWCPPRPNAQSVQDEGDVLEKVNEALLSENYREVVDKLYSQAIGQGYQRNVNLYNQTRRALRQLLQSEGGEAYWPSMQRLYHDRYANIGQDTYEYRNTLETRAWCDVQLNNERLLMLSAIPGSEMTCFEQTQEMLLRVQGNADPIWVVQGMFVPLNRAHFQHPENGKEYLAKYSEVLKWVEATESFMQMEHPEAYQAYYSTHTLAMVREESQRQLSADAAIADLETRRQQRQEEMRAHFDSINQDIKAQRLYAEALDYYKKRQYAEAYAKVNESLATDDIKEAHALKSNILQSAANASAEMSDKVAFWCAAYEAGKGYVDKRILNQMLSALRTNLFMSGLAGKIHSTRGPIKIRQRIWTLEQLKKM